LFRPRCPHPLRESGVFLLPLDIAPKEKPITMGWTIQGDGKAVFEDTEFGWRVLAETTRADGCLRAGSDHPGEWETNAAIIRLCPSDDGEFPPLEETYRRGNDLVSRFPQRDQDTFGIDTCHRVVITTPQCLAIETICSIQTNLLDSRPTIDLVIPQPAHCLDLVANKDSSDMRLTSRSADDCQPGAMPAAIHWFTGVAANGGDCALMLPEADRNAAAHVASQSARRVRLLAEFLEKGVIRKARYWTIWCASATSETELADWYERLQREPLPLTP
jgi:hypothetical protein